MTEVAGITDVVISQTPDEPKAIQRLEGQIAVTGKSLEVRIGFGGVGNIREQERDQARRIREGDGCVERPPLVARTGGNRDSVPLEELVQLRRCALPMGDV